MKRLMKYIALALTTALILSSVGVAEDLTIVEDLADVGDTLILEESPEDIPSDETVEAPAEIGDMALYDLENGASETDAEQPEDEIVSNHAVPEMVEIGVKETYKLNTSGLGKKLTFKSSKPKVAAVSSKGVVTGKKKGTAVITVLSGKNEVARCQVTVLAAPKKVSFATKSITIGIKESVMLEPIIPGGSRTTFAWSVKDKKIATVSKGGVVIGKKVGKTTVTVKTQNGKKATLTVNVLKAPSGVMLDRSSVVLDIGGGIQLNATLPEKTSSRIAWTSSDESVAVVDGSGIIIGVYPKICVNSNEAVQKAKQLRASGQRSHPMSA